MKKQVYKTVFTVEVLSLEPYDSVSLAQIAYDIVEGDSSGYFSTTSQELLSEEESLKAIAEQGSDPEFFWVTEEEE
jgi:hypothetical protein